MRRPIALLALLAVTGMLSLTLLQVPPKESKLRAAPKEFATGDPDDPQARDRWYWQQRTYPLRTIPVDAHREAINVELGRGRLAAMREQAGEATWTELGPSSLRGLTMGGSRQDASGRALTVAIHPADANIVLLGTAQGGIWRSSDAGAGFKAVAENLPTLAVKAIRFAPGNPSIVYAGTGEPHASTSIYGQGVLKSTDAGLTWQALPLSGPGWSFQYTAVSGLQVDPANSNVLYVTTAIINSTVDHFTAPNNGRPQTGIFKSTDGGQTWVRQLAARTYGGSEGGFMDLEMGNASILYASEMSGGIYKTTDGGANWSRITPWKSDTVGGALPAPVPSFSHYSAANGRFTTYNRLPFNNTVSDFGRIELGISSSNPNVIYAGYDLGNKMALDVNGNGTFDPGTDVIASVGLLFKSTDGGAGWNWLGDWPRNGVPQYCSDQCAYDNTVVVNPNNADDLVIGGTANYNTFWPDPINDPQRILAMPWRGMIYRTLDGGRSWTDTTPHCATTNYSAAGQTYGTPPLPAFQCPESAMDPARVIHPDIHNAAYEPGTGRIYIAHDGGLSRGRLVQGGTPSSSLDYRWDNLNAGLATLQFYYFDTHPSNPNIMLGGLQDNAMAYYSGQQQWESWGQGDGTIGGIDPIDPKIVYYGTQHSVSRHDNGGAKDWADPAWTEILSKSMFSGEEVGFIPVFEIDPVQSNVLYASTDAGLYRSENRGGSGGASNWARLGNLPGATTISVSPRNNKLVWIGNSVGKIFLYNGISLNERTSAPLPGRYVSKIEASPTDASTVYVTYSGYNSNTPNASGKIFRSTTQGESWTDISGNLPDVPVSGLAVDSKNPLRIWIGSDIGLFATTDGGASWNSWRRNMPVVGIMDLKYNPTTGFLTLVTHGRGAWRMNPDTAAASGSFLYFPRLANSAAEWTGLAVVNPTQQAAQLSFSAYSNSGSLLASAGLTNPRTLTLAPRSQTALIGFQIFGLSLDTTSAWVKVSSNIPGLAGFFLALDPAPNTMDGVDVSDSLSQNFLFAEPRNAEISLVNPNESQSASVTLRFVNNQGDVGAPQVVSILPNGRYSGTVAGLFSSSLVDAGGYVSVSSSIGLAGTELFGVPNSYLAALNPIETAGGARLLYSPQYAVGGGVWKTTLTLINLESSATTVSLALIGDNGAPIGRTAALNLPPRGRAVISDPGVLGVSSGAEVIQGYVRVTSESTRVAGYVRFGDPSDAQFQTALPFVTQSRNELIYSQVAQNETYFTGVAIINTDAAPAIVTVTVFNSDGQQVGSGKQIIPSNARISKLLPEIIPTLPALSGGYFRVSSDRPVFSFAVFGTNTLSVLAAVPAQAVTP